MKIWKCTICGYITQGDTPPEVCPLCGVGAEFFEEVIQEEHKKESTNKHILIIGNGIAGITAAQQIRSYDEGASITMFSKDRIPGYERIMLTKDLMKFNESDYLVKDADWYKEQNIDLLLNTEIVRIDPHNKLVEDASGKQYAYDELILAMGSYSFVPPIKGHYSKNVKTIRVIQDVFEIRKLIEGKQHAVIIGGGVLGIEAALSLHHSGMKVTVLEMAPQLMGRQIDKGGSDVLERILKQRGLDVHYPVSIKEIQQDGNGLANAVVLNDGTQFPADLIIISTGVRSELSLLKDIDIKIDRSIVVDEHMKTSIDHIYACGDIAQYQGINYNLWTQAAAMGEICGKAICNQPDTYQQIDPAVTLHGENIDLYAIGDMGRSDNDYIIVQKRNDVKNEYLTLYFLNQHMVGGICINQKDIAAKLQTWYQKNASLMSVQHALFR